MSQALDASADEADRCTPVEIDLLDDPREWLSLKAARLEALEDSPEAFVTTPAEEERRTPSEWMASIRWSTWAIARDEGAIVGIACLTAATESDDKRARFIESVWVAPEHRRKGLVRRMLWRLEREARAADAEYLKLWVLKTNDLAYNAYLKLDFSEMPDKAQDSWKPQGDGNFVQERLMVKPLL